MLARESSTRLPGVRNVSDDTMGRSTQCSECGEELWGYPEAHGLCVRCRNEALDEHDAEFQAEVDAEDRDERLRAESDANDDPYWPRSAF